MLTRTIKVSCPASPKVTAGAVVTVFARPTVRTPERRSRAESSGRAFAPATLTNP